MCLIVDTCCFSNVFDPTNANHADFKPVLVWVTKGGGRVIYGGTKYKSELKKSGRYLSLLVELSRRGRVVILDDKLVDAVEKVVRGKENNPDFDDPHLLALVIVSHCKVICTNDKRAHKFIKKSSLYPPGMSRPSIYSSKKNSDLLVKTNIVGKCLGV